MVGAERFLPDCQGALLEWLRLAIAALGIVELRQIVERFRDLGMVGAEGLLPDRQGALEERFRLAVTALGNIQRRQVVER